MDLKPTGIPGVAPGTATAVLAAFAVAAAVLAAAHVAARWRIFAKAGQKGWKALVPVYGDYVQWKLSWSTATFAIALACAVVGTAVPAVAVGALGIKSGAAAVAAASVSGTALAAGYALSLVAMHKLLGMFGRSAAWLAVYVLAPTATLLMLAFGKAEYGAGGGGSAAAGKTARRRKPKRALAKELKRSAGSDAVATTNDLAGFKYLFEDGMAETLDGVFCRTIEFGDISYENEREDVKRDIYEKFNQLHATFPAGTCYQINLLNIPEVKRGEERYLPEEGKDVDLAVSYNSIIAERQRKGRTEFERPNYLTFSVAAEDDREAARKLGTLSESASMQLNRINVTTSPLDGVAKAGVLHKMLVGPGSPMLLDYERLRRTKKEHVRDFLTPAWAAYPGPERFERKYLSIPGRLVKSYHIRDFGSDLSDNAIRTIRALPIPMNISLLFRPQPKGESVKTILTNIDNVQAEMLDYSRSVARSGGDPTLMPPSLENKEASSREQLAFIQEQDQTVSWFQGIITVWAENEEKLAEYDDMIMSEKGNWTLDIVEMPCRQEPALTGALPLATPRLDDSYRSLNTAESAVMVPFASQNIHDDPQKSYLIGVDRVSGDSVLINPDKLKSPHMWLFGITGGGKSMEINSIVSYSLLQYPRTAVDEASRRWVSPDPLCPQWHIFDFHEEYVQLGKLYDAEISHFGPSHESCLNPMDMSNAEGELTRKEVVDNTDFFLSLFESMMGRMLSKREQSIIDDCLTKVYAGFIGTKSRPTLEDLYGKLREASGETDASGAKTPPAMVADEIADSLMMYVTGSMSSFAAQTNVRTSPHMNVYVMSEVGDTMQTLAMMSAIQHVRKCAYRNFAIGKPTYMIVEECQILFDNEAAVRVLESLFAEMRKYGLHIICVTQLPNRVLSHPRAVNLFENSGLFVFLPQQAENAETMARMFSLSPTQKDALSLFSDRGTGLVIADGVKIAFRNTIPHDTLCYKLWNTDPNRNAAAAKDPGEAGAAGADGDRRERNSGKEALEEAAYGPGDDPETLRRALAFASGRKAPGGAGATGEPGCAEALGGSGGLSTDEALKLLERIEKSLEGGVG